MLLVVLAVLVLIVIFGVTRTNIFSGIAGLISALLIGGVGIALLGTAIAFPPVMIAIVIFFVLRGMFR